MKTTISSTSSDDKNLVRIAGLEPACLAALPPQSSVSANSTICAQPGHISCLIARAVQVISAAHEPVPALPVAGGAGVEAGIVGFFEVELEQQADAVRAAA